MHKITEELDSRRLIAKQSIEEVDSVVVEWAKGQWMDMIEEYGTVNGDKMSEILGIERL